MSVQTLERKVAGRHCLVRDREHNDRAFFGATVIDEMAGEPRARRVRLQTGEHAGEVLLPGQYDILEFTD